MHIEQPGLILFTEHYDDSVHFYRDVVGLPVLFTRETLTCLAFGSAYLMIELGGVAGRTEKPRTANPVVLRFNVLDVEAAAAELRTHGVVVRVEPYDWGIIGVFDDPDGNRCELKDAWPRERGLS